MADRKITDLTALTTPASADVLPIVDVSEAAAADKNKKITVGELFKGVPDGTAAAPGLAFESDDGNGMFLGGTDILAFSTGGTQAVTIDASQRLGLGTSTPGSFATSDADNLVIGSNSGDNGLTIVSQSGNYNGTIRFSDGTSGADQYRGTIQYYHGDNYMRFLTNGTEQVRIDNSGRLGLGTSTPGSYHSNSDDFVIKGDNPGITIATDTTYGTINFVDGTAAGNQYRGYIQYVHTSDILFIGTADTSALAIDSSQRVGIGTNSPSQRLDVNGNISLANGSTIQTGSSSHAITIQGGASAPGGNIRFAGGTGDNDLRFSIGTSEAARIDSSGRLLVGTSTAQSTQQIQAANTGGENFGAFRFVNSAGPCDIALHKSRGSLGAHAIVQNNDAIGSIAFRGSDGSAYRNAAAINAYVDGTPGASDMPGRLVFSTTADGASSPTERMRIDSNGRVSIAHDGSYYAAGETLSISASDNGNVHVGRATNASFSSNLMYYYASRAQNSAYTFLRYASNAGSDTEFNLRGDGNAYADGSWNGGGADYAEYFEWSDGNASAEDRRGISVVLDGDKIREAVAGEEPIGVISGNPSVVGDADIERWKGKYLRDDFGTYIQEDYEVEDENGNTVVQQRRKLNPDYDPDLEYISREDRPEWDCVGLMGKLRIRKGQVTGARWIKMRDISDNVEEWLVR